jgi:hypothetical protein
MNTTNCKNLELLRTAPQIRQQSSPCNTMGFLIKEFIRIQFIPGTSRNILAQPNAQEFYNTFSRIDSGFMALACVDGVDVRLSVIDVHVIIRVETWGKRITLA